MALGVTDITEALGFYIKHEIGKVIHGKKHRLLINQLPKKSKCGGRDYRVPVLADWEGITSPSLVKAQAYPADASPTAFQVGANLKRTHRVAQLGSDLLLAVEDDREKLYSETFIRMDMALEPGLDEIERILWGDGYGTLGQVSGAPGGSAFIVSPFDDAKHFKPGMGVVAAATKGGTLIDTGAIAVVSKNDPTTGTVTLTAALSTTLASLADTNYLFPAGTSAADSDGFCAGVEAFADATDTNLLGVNLSTNPTKLAMLTHSGSLSDILASIQDADAKANSINGGMRTKFACNPQLFQKLVQELQVQTQFAPAKVNSKGEPLMAGYSYASIAGQHGGPIECVSSPYISYGTTSAVGYLLDWDSWELAHNRGTVMFIDDLHGHAASQLATVSGIEVRALGRYGLSTNRPGNNVKISFS